MFRRFGYALSSKCAYAEEDSNETSPWSGASANCRRVFDCGLAGTRKLVSPQAGLAFDLQGPDSFGVGIRPAPRADAPEGSAEMAEVYWMALLRDVGVKVVELTGPHILDNGVGSFLYTLDLYKQNNMQVYGGGANLADARQPLLIENHGNKLAFIG